MHNLKIGEDTYQIENPVWRREFTLEGIKSIIISCLEKDAQGIWFNGVDYHIEDRPEYKHHELQTVELTEGEDIPPSNIGEARAVKLAELADACEAAIYAGISVETVQGMEHFAMTLEDQTNIGSLMLQAQMGSPVLYHSDGELCRWFEPDEFAKVEQAVVTHKTYHTTLCNHLNTWVRRTDDIDEISKIRYDSVLPKDLADRMNGLLSDGK